jgi:hypothetical protein
LGHERLDWITMLSALLIVASVVAIVRGESVVRPEPRRNTVLGKIGKLPVTAG